MSFGRNVVATATAIIVAAGVGTGGVFYAEHRAITQLDDALKSLPSGLTATYSTARYSLISGEWNIEGLQLRHDEIQMMKIADLTIIDLDRETLKAVLDSQVLNTGRALARSVSFNGLTIRGSLSSSGDRNTFSISHAAVPFPYFRSALTGGKLFSPREWLEVLQAPEVLALGVRWNESNTAGRIDRLSLDKLTQLTRTKGTGGAFVWSAADGDRGEAAVGGAVISDISVSWRRRETGNSRQQGEKVSGSLQIKEFEVKEGMLRPLLAFRASQEKKSEMSVLGEWLQGADGQVVTIGGLNVALNEEGHSDDREDDDQAPWQETFSVGRLEADRADGAGHFAGLVLKDVRFVHDDVASPTPYHVYNGGNEPARRRVGVGRFEGKDVVFREKTSDFSFENATVEDVDFFYGDSWDEGVRGSVASFGVQNVVNRDGRPVAADISTRRLKLVFPEAEDQYENGGWAKWLASPVLTADMDFSYALDEQNGMLEIDKFDLAVTPVGRLFMTMKLALGSEKGDSFADDDIAADFLQQIMPQRWSAWIAENVQLRSADLRYNDDSGLEKYADLLRLPQEDEESVSDMSEWNGFIGDPKAKTLHLTISPRQPVSIATLLAMFNYYPFGSLKEALGVSLHISSQGGQTP